MQGATVIPTQLTAVRALPLLYSQGIGFAAVWADETVARAVIAVRCKICAQKVVASWCVEEVIVNDAVLKARAAGIQRACNLAA